jgi:hypothetical protein
MSERESRCDQATIHLTDQGVKLTLLMPIEPLSVARKLRVFAGLGVG